MGIIKNQGQRNKFAIIPNETLADDRLSWKAKGLLAYLLSLPYDWEVYTSEVAKHATDGVDSLTSGLKELMDLNYIKRTKIRGKNGKYEGWEYCVYDIPTESGISSSGEAYFGKKGLG